MKHLLKTTLALLAAAVLAITFSGCNDDSSSAAGPSGSGSFAGSSISFNPTVNFLAGDTLTYVNTEVGSPFPAAPTAINGTYTYTPNAAFTAGTLTLTLDGIVDPVVLEISAFTRSGTAVTGFTARSGGQNYPVTVTGTLTAYTPPTSGGGAGESRADDIPSAMQGTHVLKFHKSDTAAISGVPADGTETTFVLGARTLAFDGKTLTDPIFYAGNKFEWIFKDGSIWWAVSEAVGGGLNEINVQGPYTGSGNAFYGQYNDRESNAAAGYNSIGVGQNGGYVGGSFTASVTTVVGPDTMPSGSHLAVQSLTQGQTISVYFSNSGDLTSPDLDGTFTYNASDATSVSYLRSRPSDSPSVADTITIHKNSTTGLPQTLSIYSVRTQVTPSVKSTQATYTLSVNVP